MRSEHESIDQLKHENLLFSEETKPVSMFQHHKTNSHNNSQHQKHLRKVHYHTQPDE